MFFLSKNKNKKLLVFLLAFFIFSGAISAFTDVQVVSAGFWVSENGLWSDIGVSVKNCADPLKCLWAPVAIGGQAAGETVGDALKEVFRWLLMGVFTVVGILPSIAI